MNATHPYLDYIGSFLTFLQQTDYCDYTCLFDKFFLTLYIFEKLLWLVLEVGVSAQKMSLMVGLSDLKYINIFFNGY